MTQAEQQHEVGKNGESWGRPLEPYRIGEEYAKYFRMKCLENGIRIASEGQIDMIDPEESLREQLSIVKDANPDALAYFGIGANGRKMNPALESLDWDPPKIMCTAFVGATFSREGSQRLDGWVGVDQYHEGNEVNNAVVARYQEKFGDEVKSSIATTSYDVAHAMPWPLVLAA
jgi:hypothetical protein